MEIETEEKRMKRKLAAALLCAGVLAFAPVVEPALTLPGGGGYLPASSGD